MKKRIISVIFYMIFFISFDMFSGFNHKKNKNIPYEKHFVVAVTNYNSIPWVEKNLDSIFCQKYTNFEVVYVDDNSTDGTVDLAESYVIENGQQDKFTFIRNTERVGAHANQYRVIHKCNDDDIIVVLDGDDWFSNDGVLSLLNEVYSDTSVWITYGQFQFHPSGMAGGCRALSSQEIKNLGSRQFRKNYRAHVLSAPRTFYAGLYKKINKKDIMYNGKFLFVAGDVAIMLPMIEMAKNGHFRFISDVLYVYNCERASRPEENQPERARMAMKMFAEIKKKAPYRPLEILF